MIKFDKLNLSFEKPINLYECESQIHQLKLVENPEKEIILILVEEIGLITTLIINYNKEKREYESKKIKKFNGKINSSDNSVWSLDFYYPYILIGGNHKCVMILNYLDESQNEIIDNSNIYVGNENNIPVVYFSDNGLFIANNSIDCKVKIFDFYKGNLICSINNPKKEWGWGVKFIKKNLFSFTNDIFDYENETNLVINSLGLEKANETNKNEYPNYNENINNNNLSQYEKFLKDNLIDKYYIFSTYKDIAYLNELHFVEKDDGTKEVKSFPIGKIELLRNYLLAKYQIILNLDYNIIVTLNHLISGIRYDYIFISEKLKLILIGGKNGDLQIYKMLIEENKNENKIGIKSSSEIIINFKERIAGMKFFEIDDNKIDVYVLSLSGTLYNYRILSNEY